MLRALNVTTGKFLEFLIVLQILHKKNQESLSVYTQVSVD